MNLSQWYRHFARDYLTDRISELSVQHRLPYKRLFIRSQRMKWESCSTRGNVSLNWRLILAPKYVCDYVILHELMHTKVLNHSHGSGSCQTTFPRCHQAIAWSNAHKPPF